VTARRLRTQKYYMTKQQSIYKSVDRYVRGKSNCKKTWRDSDGGEVKINIAHHRFYPRSPRPLVAPLVGATSIVATSGASDQVYFV